MKLGELAAALELPVEGDANCQIDRLAPIERAGAGELSFVVDSRYQLALQQSRAAAVIIPASLASVAPGNYLLSANPYASYARASWLLHPEPQAAAGVHASATVHAGASIAASASIGAHAVIEDGAVIEQHVVIGAHAFVGKGTRIGAGSHLFARVTIYHDCVLGQHCRVQSGAVIGAEGFGFAYDEGWLPIHQTGGVRIGDNVHIGANTTIDRGAIEHTEIASGVILDNQIQIAHNVRIGENTAIAGCVGIAGSTRIGRNCQIGGACNIVGHLRIADNVILNATSFVAQSITEAGRYSSGMPLQNAGAWRRSYAVLTRLDDMLKRIRRLEKTNK